MDVLYCALNKNKFNRIYICSFTKKVQNILEIIYKDTNKVKESKISMLAHEYEIFKMESYEFISDIFLRFKKIINDLNLLKKSHTNIDLMRKILRSLSRS